MKLKIFFCQYPNPWTLRVSGMGGYTSKCEKKSKSLHPNTHTCRRWVGEKWLTWLTGERRKRREKYTNILKGLAHEMPHGWVGAKWLTWLTGERRRRETRAAPVPCPIIVTQPGSPPNSDIFSCNQKNRHHICLEMSPHKVLTYIEHHSVCPLVGIGTPPPL